MPFKHWKKALCSRTGADILLLEVLEMSIGRKIGGELGQ